MATFYPRNGLIAFEIESDQPASNWRATSQYPDDSGNMAYRYVGGNNYGKVNNATVMDYTFQVENSGTYFLSVRSRRELDGRKLVPNHQADGPKEVANDEENDFWVTVDNAAWKKVFFSGKFGAWTWAETFDGNHSKSAAAFNLSVGTHTFKIGGRSEGAIADRVHLNLGSVNKDASASLSPEKPGGVTPPPSPDPKPPVSPDPKPPVSGDALNVFLVDIKTDKNIAQITNGASIAASLVEGKTVGIYAEVKAGSSLAGKVGSIKIYFENGEVKKTENVAPYSLFRENDGDFTSGIKMGAGVYSIDFDAYSGRNGSGSKLADFDLDFTIKGGSSGGGGGVPEIGDADADVIVFLVDVKTGSKMFEVGDNARISRTELANKSVALVAEARDGGRLDGKVGSMKLDFEDGQIVRVDNIEPFAVFGESSGGLVGRTLGRGYYDLDIYSYAGSNATGGLLDTYKHDFEVF